MNLGCGTIGKGRDAPELERVSELHPELLFIGKYRCLQNYETGRVSWSNFRQSFSNGFEIKYLVTVGIIS